MLVICYDSLLLAGVLFLSAVFFPLLPDGFEFSMAGKLVKGTYLLGISFVFFGWFWTHGGQTLGMRAWNLYLVKADGKFINWRTAFIRFAVAIVSWVALGLGFTWILLNKRNRSWHDIASGSQIVFVDRQLRGQT